MVDESQSRELVTSDDTGEFERVLEEEPVTVPVFVLRAALSVTGPKWTNVDGKKVDVPAELQGVHIESGEDEVRLCATDGRRLFAYSMPTGGAAVPGWLSEGVTVSLQPMLKEQVAFLDQVGDLAVVNYQTGAPRVELSDMGRKAVFQAEPMTSQYPRYESWFAHVDLSARQTLDLESTAYQSLYLKGVADLAKLLDSKSVQVFTPAGEGKATLVTFPECPGASLVIMPLAHEDDYVPAQTSRLLSGPIAGTVAALRAHRTRWNEKLKKAPDNRSLQRKVAEYDARIADILRRTTEVQALPPQQAEPEEDPPEAEDEGEAEQVEPAPEPSNGEAARILSRSRLNGAAQAKALAKFYADVNAELSRGYGFNISHLSEGVPLDGWWKSGFTPEQAASRCLDWKPKAAKDEPPSDETK